MSFVSGVRKWFANKSSPLPFVLFFVAANGLGSQLIYQACVGAALAWSFYESRTWSTRIIGGLSLALFFFFPSIGHSFGLIALLLICCNKGIEAAALLGSQLLILSSPVLPTGSLWMSPLCSGSIYAALYVLLTLRQRRKIAMNGLIVLYSLCLLWQSNMSWTLDSVPSAGIGDAIGKITHTHPRENGRLVYLNQEYTSVNPFGSIYLDHDAHTDYDEGNFFQPRPWSHNVLIAGEPLRMAAALDGALISNLGAKCSDAYGHILYAMMADQTICPLAINYKGHLVLADSDYVSDVLAPYQRNLLRRLTGADIEWRVYWGILALALIASLFVRPRWLPMINMGTATVFILWPKEGDIRYVGEPCLWPHTTQAGGVARAMQEAGHNVMIGNRNTRILVISEGFSATAGEKEKLIILEPDACVNICGIKYSAGNIPQGDVNGVRDARVINKGEQFCAYGRVKIGDIELIATGSPARIMEKERE